MDARLLAKASQIHTVALLLQMRPKILGHITYAHTFRFPYPPLRCHFSGEGGIQFFQKPGNIH